MRNTFGIGWKMTWGLCLSLAVLASGCATGKTRAAVVKSPMIFDQRPTLKSVAENYTNKCACGARLSNNCAHFLSDAFIRAGYKELMTDASFTKRCAAGRPIRAQELLYWFQGQSKQFLQGKLPPNTGYWAVYQEKGSKRHVTLIDSDTGKYYGTDNCVNWPVQWHYQW